MKVILHKDVPNLGDAGEIKDVADGYARNFLLPRKLVSIANAGSTKAIEHQQKLITLRLEKRNKEMQTLSDEISKISSVDITVRVGAKRKLFGSVTNQNISHALKEKGFSIDKRKIDTDPIRALGSYKIRVKLTDKIIVPLTVNVLGDENDLQAIAEDEARDAKYAEKAKASTEEAPKTEEGEKANSES